MIFFLFGWHCSSFVVKGWYTYKIVRYVNRVPNGYIYVVEYVLILSSDLLCTTSSGIDLVPVYN